MVRRGWALVAIASMTFLVGCGGDDSSGAAPPRGATPTDAEGAPSADGAVRYLAIGDSLTQGEGATDESTGAFPIVLADEWRADGCDVEVLNVGISGYTAGQMITDELPNVADFAPTIVTFQSGANDIVNAVTAEQYRSDVSTILDEATGSGARVIVLYQNEWFRAPFNADGSYGDQEVFAQQRVEFDEILAEEAEARGAEIVDLRDIHEQTADEELWVEDGVHPPEEVYAEWAGAIAEAVPAPCE